MRRLIVAMLFAVTASITAIPAAGATEAPAPRCDPNVSSCEHPAGCDYDQTCPPPKDPSCGPYQTCPRPPLKADISMGPVSPQWPL